jgi:hypothetical protein
MSKSDVETIIKEYQRFKADKTYEYLHILEKNA